MPTDTATCSSKGGGVIRQREQAGFFLGEHVPDGALGFAGATPIGGEAKAPGLRLGIEVIEIDKLAGGEKGLAHITNGPFDAALFVAASDRHGTRFVTILSGEAEQSGMETDRVATPFQHRALEIVV